MQVITALQLQRTHKDRVNVYLDGEYAFSVGLDLAAGLRRGQVLDVDAIAAVRSEDAYRIALAQALQWLGYRPRSSGELAARLARGGTDPAHIGRVIDRLRELQLVDDAAFADWWVAQRLEHRPAGARALTHELRQRGVEPDLIADAVAGLDEPALAARLALQHAPRYRAHGRPVFERRLAGVLQRRGFDGETIRAAVAAAWTAHAPPMD